MARVPAWRRYLRLFGSDIAADVDDEIRFHVDLKTRELIAQGMEPRAARPEALRQFGDVAAIRGMCEQIGKRSDRQMRWKDCAIAWTEEARYAFRSLRQQKAFSAIAALTLAAGIGGAACLFSFIQAFVLEPLPFRDPDRLMYIRSFDTGQSREMSMSIPDFEDVRAGARTLGSMAAWSYITYTLSDGPEPERVAAAEVSHGFFETLGVRPALGRTFLADESTYGRHRVAIVSHGFWQSRLRGAALGSVLTLDGASYQVVGVLPEHFHFTLVGRSNIWTPLARPAEEVGRRQYRFLQVIGRLADGATVAQAGQELRAMAAVLAKRHPASNTGIGSFSMSLRDEVGRHTGSDVLLVVFAITIGLLLIACSNVTNLLLVRAIGRLRQAAIQLSVGASPASLVRQALMETLLLFGVAAALGLIGAWRATSWLCGLIPFENRGFLPNYGIVSLNWQVFVFAFGIAAVAGAIFGIAPALELSRANVTSVLKDSGGVSHGSLRRRLRSALVIAQIAIAAVLLCSNGLMIAAFRGMWDVPPGFDTANLLSFRLALDQKRFPDAVSREAFFRRVREAVAEVPQAGTPALAAWVPFGTDHSARRFQIEGEPPPNPDQLPMATYNVVSPEFFRTLRVPVREGRVFDRRDGPEARPVAMVNDVFVERFLGGSHPIGKRIVMPGARVTVEIIGVAGEIRYDSERRRRDPQIYQPFAQVPAGEAFILVRADSDPLALLPAIRRKVAEVDRQQPIFDAKTIEQRIGERFAPHRIISGMLAAFGVLSLLLAAVGVYGVVSFSVSHRTREIGIRAALGADRGSLRMLVLGEGMRLLAIAIVPGAGAAIAVASLLRAVIPEPESVGLTQSLLIPSAVLAVAVLLATWIPARRAASIDPVQAIRSVSG